jgi:hypothetical protein
MAIAMAIAIKSKVGRRQGKQNGNGNEKIVNRREMPAHCYWVWGSGRGKFTI